MRPNLLSFLAACLLFGISRQIAAAEPTGSIKGEVLSVSTGQSVAGASILIEATSLGGSAGENGEFVLERVPVGTYALHARCVGYALYTRSGVVVRPGRTTHVSIRLSPAPVEIGDQVVMPQPDASAGPPGTSAFTLNAEEVRRSPGSFADISRVLKVLPSMAQASDNAADLIVRGGSPAENAFYVDRLLVPNINHYPVLGSSGGLMSMLNVDLIDAVTTSVGGFDVSFGDRMSSVTEITYRKGNQDDYDAQIELNMAGFGAVVEGPLPAQRGSFLLSARRSFLELIVDQIGTGVAPQYGDIQGKISVPVAHDHVVDILGLWGASNYTLTMEKALSLGMTESGSYNTRQGTLGLTWRYLWPLHGFTETALAWSSTDGSYDLERIESGDVGAANEYREYWLRGRTQSTYSRSPRHQFTAGMEFEYYHTAYDYVFGSTRNGSGLPVPELTVTDRHEQQHQAIYGSWTWFPVPVVRS